MHYERDTRVAFGIRSAPHAALPRALGADHHHGDGACTAPRAREGSPQDTFPHQTPTTSIQRPMPLESSASRRLQLAAAIAADRRSA